MRAQLEQAPPPDNQVPIDRTALGVEKSIGGRPRAGSPSNWAMLIKRIYKVDPLKCGKCSGEMQIISFIERDQRPVIDRILRRLRFREGPIRTLPNSRRPLKGAEQDPDEPRELQLVLDPEFL
jgi:hypothetical protein